MQTRVHRLPLLHDHHNHPLLYATFLDGVDLGRDPAETREQALARIRDRARAGEPGWTIVHGWNSGRYALAKEDVAGLPPVVVFDLSLHGLFVNEAGRELLERADPEVAANVEDQGWAERNLYRVLNLFADAGAAADRIARFYARLLAEHGVWHAEEMLLVGESEVRLFDEAGLAGRTRFWAVPELYDGLPSAVQARVHGIKLFTDGALGTRSAALFAPYRGSADAGILLHGPGRLEALLARYLGLGKAASVHAIGDRAVDQAVAAIEAVRPAAGGPEIRIEHAQFISEPAARRAKALGVKLCMQPNFSDDSVHYADRLPLGYPDRNNPFRMLIDGSGYLPGVDLLFGSDGMPHGAREALRQSLFPPHAGQVLTVAEFVAGYCQPVPPGGHLEVRIDRDRRQVDCRVVISGR